MALTSLYCKMWLFLLKQEEVIELYQMTVEVSKFMKLSDYASLSAIVKTCKQITKFLVIGANCTLTFWTFYAISQKTFIFHAWYPIPYHKDYSYIYWLEISFNYFVMLWPVMLRYFCFGIPVKIICNVFYSGCMEIIPLIFMALLECHLKCLGNKLCNLHTLKEGALIFNELRNCIDYHIHLLRLFIYC